MRRLFGAWIVLCILGLFSGILFSPGHHELEQAGASTRTAAISDSGKRSPRTSTAARTPTQAVSQFKHASLTGEELDLLAHAVYGEARGEPYAGQVAVAAVILNRVADPRFPDTVAEVIYQPGAFTAVADKQIYLVPDETAYQAARDAVRGADPTGGAAYYYNPARATSDWIWSREVVTVIGRHWFAN